MSILWEPPSEARQQVGDVRGVRLGAQEWQEPHGVSTQPVGASHYHEATGHTVVTHTRGMARPLYINPTHTPVPRDAEDAPAGDKLIALVIGAVSGGMVGLVLGYALGVL